MKNNNRVKKRGKKNPLIKLELAAGSIPVNNQKNVCFSQIKTTETRLVQTSVEDVNAGNETRTVMLLGVNTAA